MANHWPTSVAVYLCCALQLARTSEIYIPDPPTGCEPPEFTRGTYSPSYTGAFDLFPVGTKLTFRCSLEYELIGSQYATCLSTGKWNALPQCLDGCRPQDVRFGDVSPKSSKGYYEYGDVIHVTCDYGYLRVRSPNATCMEGGIWSSYLQCTDGCMAPNLPYMTTLPTPVEGESVYKVNDEIHFRCDKGYIIRGPKQAVCLSGDKWDRELPICEKMVYCKTPTQLTKGTYLPVQRLYRVGEKIAWSCNNGYRRRGSKTSMCKDDGNFHPSRPICREYKGKTDFKPKGPGSYYSKKQACYKPYLPEGCIIKPDQPFYKLTKEVKFSCKHGYRMVGSATAICRRQGMTPDPPICEPITCPLPSLMPFTQFLETPREKYYVGEEVCYICAQNYVMSGSQCTTCQDNGQFSPRPPKCRPPTCRFDCTMKEGRPCQCDIECKYNGNCCPDFQQHCRKLWY